MINNDILILLLESKFIYEWELPQLPNVEKLKDLAKQTQDTLQQVNQQVQELPNTVNKGIETLNSNSDSFVQNQFKDIIGFGDSGLELIKKPVFVEWLTGLKKKAETFQDAQSAMTTAITKGSKLKNLYNETPESLKPLLEKFFLKFGDNELIYKLIDISNGNPLVYAGIVAAIPVALSTLLIGGGIYAFKKIKEYNINKNQLDQLNAQLINSNTDAERNQVTKSISLLGAKALVYSYFTKNK